MFLFFPVPPLGVKIISDDQPLVAGKEYLLGKLKGPVIFVNGTGGSANETVRTSSWLLLGQSTANNM